MNNGSLFNFLSNLADEIYEGSVYDKLDFTKKEDVEKLDNAIEVLKDNDFFNSLFGEEIFDELQTKAHKIYEESNKKVPTRPSSNVSDDVKDNIRKLAHEYVKTKITPYVKNITNEQYNEIIDSLFEFGCWIYNK